MKKWLFLMGLIVYFSACKKDENGRGDLSVTVTSANYGHAPLKGLTVFTVPASKEGITNDKGSVILKDIPAKAYNVYAMLEGYSSGTGIALVKGGDVVQLNVTAYEGAQPPIFPQVSIQTPYERQKFSASDKIKFVVQATDDVTSPQDLKVVISSNLDGKMFESHPDKTGYLGFVSTSLTEGNHLITVTVTDKDNYKTTKQVNISTTLPGFVVLDTAFTSGGNVQLKWQKYLLNDLGSIDVYRAIDQNTTGQLIKSFHSSDTLNYVDKTAPFLNQVYYYLRVVNKYGEVRNSNRVKVSTPSGKFYSFAPGDAVHHPSKQIVYIVDNGSNKIRAINYVTNSEIDNASYNGTAGKIDIGDTGNGMEVYVPTSSGYIYVYDANTLNLNATILTGYRTYSVIANRHGYLVAGVTPSSTFDKPLRTYSRQTGINIDGFGYYSGVVRSIPNSDNIVCLSTDVSPTQRNYYEINGTGNYLKNLNLTGSDYNPIDPLIFRVSPNGQFLITSVAGGVYLVSPQLTYKGGVVRGDMQFSDFAFSPDGNTIYAGTSNKASIQIVRYPLLTATTEIPTRGYPKFLFYYNGEVITINLASVGSSTFGIERIKVN